MGNCRKGPGQPSRRCASEVPSDDSFQGKGTGACPLYLTWWGRQILSGAMQGCEGDPQHTESNWEPAQLMRNTGKPRGAQSVLAHPSFGKLNLVLPESGLRAGWDALSVPERALQGRDSPLQNVLLAETPCSGVGFFRECRESQGFREEGGGAGGRPQLV